MIRIQTSLFVLLMSFFTDAAFAEQWQEVSRPSGGSIESLLIIDDNTLMVGTSQNFVFRSDDGGRTWQQKREGLYNSRATILYQTGSGAIWAGTYSGFFETTDLGENWTQAGNSPSGAYITGIVRNTDGTLFATQLGKGISKSTDDGTTWTASNTGLENYNISALAIDNSGTLYCSVSYDGLYRSRDSGSEWEKLNVSENYLQITDILVDRDGRVWVATHGYGVFRSEDGGDSWNEFNNMLRDYNTETLFEDQNGTIWTGTFWGYVFNAMAGTDGWTEIFHWQEPFIIANLRGSENGTLYLGTVGRGLYRSLDDGFTWVPSDKGLDDLDVTGIYSMGFSELLLTTTTNGIFTSNNFGESWQSSPEGPVYDRLAVYYEQTTGNLYTNNGYSFSILRSVDRGASWQELPIDENIGYPLSMVSDSDGALLMGTNKNQILRSENQGESWSELYSRPDTDVMIFDIFVLADNSIVATLYNSGILKSNPERTEWIIFTDGLDLLNVSHLAHTKSNILYTWVNQQSVYLSLNDGQSWSKLQNDRSFNTLELAIDSHDNLYFALVNSGVCVSWDLGITLVPINEGLDSKNYWTRDVSVTAGDTLLLAGMNGVFWREIPQLPSSWNGKKHLADITSIKLAGDFFINSPEIQSGDFIGVFTSEGEICGMTRFTASRIFSFTVRGDDPATPEKDGFLPGETMYFHIYRPSTGEEIGPFYTEFEAGSDKYQSGELYVLKKFVTETQVMATARFSEKMLNLAPNYPNPFNSSTRIGFQLEQPAYVEMDVFDVQGRIVRHLHKGHLGRGDHQVVWDSFDDSGRDVASGIYFIVFSADMAGKRYHSRQKLTLIK
ncbi:hypothetical protein JW935_25575 [candidate division KSB1 bacterium]|nr:hypothetical protein [candidate division KSB1 bacterium]